MTLAVTVIEYTRASNWQTKYCTPKAPTNRNDSAWRKRLSLLLLFLSVPGIVSRAQQTTGDIVGTVKDAAGSTIAGATVNVENVGTHAIRTVTTGPTGDYSVSLLSVGSYTVKISAPGFKSFEVTALPLSVGDRSRVNATLQVGSVSESVEVEGETAALHTDTSVLSSTINSKAVQDLPLNGRNFITLITMAPGASEGQQSGNLGSGNALDDRRPGVTLSVNSQSEIGNDQLLDGGDNIERLIYSVAVRPSIDSIQEISLQTSNYSPEYGRTAGGVINIISKSGTNAFHGDVFEFLRNDIFDASPYGFGKLLPKAELRLNQFGGSIGGPIVKDKFFFFGDYEAYRKVAGANPSSSVVPTLYEEQHPGDFSDVGGPKITSGLDSVGLAYFSLYPAPNSGNNTYVGAGKLHQDSTVYDIRVDEQITPKNHLFERFSYNKVLSLDDPIYPKKTLAGVTLFPQSARRAPDFDANAMIDWVHTFSGNLLMDLKASYTRSDNEAFDRNAGLNPNAAFGQPGVNSPFAGANVLASITVSNGSGLGGSNFAPLTDADNTFQYGGSIVYTRGTHDFKFGSTLIRRQLTSIQSNSSEGTWSFQDYPSLVTGRYNSVTQSLSLHDPHFRIWEPSFYAQDTWHIRQNLILNLGARYEFFTPYKEIQGFISNFDPVTAQAIVGGTGGIQTDYHGLAPRLGFAYTVMRGMVVRGGFGMSYFPMNVAAGANLKNPPFVVSFGPCGVVGPGAYGKTSANTSPCPAGFTTFANGLPAPQPASISPIIGSFGAEDLHYRTSYAYQYNLAIEKDFAGNVATVSYVGLQGRHLSSNLADLNGLAPGVCGASCNINKLRPYYSQQPQMTKVGYQQAAGNSLYSSLQTSFERRLKNGLTFNANYTYSHLLDDVDLTGLNGFATGVGLIPSNLRADYGNGTLDLRNRFEATTNYALPFGQSGGRLTKTLIGGWQTNLVLEWQTGQNFTPMNSANISNTVPGTPDRANQVGDPYAGSCLKQLNCWFNATAFKSQAAGTLGNVRRNQLWGPHFRHMDFSLFKMFPIHESTALEFRAESFNLLNMTNFSRPNMTVGTSTFAKITSTVNSYNPRQLQFALKLHF